MYGCPMTVWGSGRGAFRLALTVLLISGVVSACGDFVDDTKGEAPTGVCLELGQSLRRPPRTAITGREVVLLSSVSIMNPQLRTVIASVGSSGFVVEVQNDS